MDLSDLEIIEGVLSGNTDKFEIIVDRYGGLVFSISAKRVPPEDIDETAHLVFIKIFRSLRGFRGEAPFSHWISSIAIRTCSDYWRKRYRSKEFPVSRLSEKHREWINNTLSGESHVSFKQREKRSEAREILMIALGKLNPKDRAVLEMVHIEERPVKEAASLLGYSVSNVKVRSHRARKKLRSVLERMIENEE